MNRKIEIFMDIETIPTQSVVIKDYIESTLTAPANYKKPEAIQEWIENNKDSTYRKTALNGAFGQIVCISCAINNDTPKVFYSENWANDERKIIQEFFDYMKSVYKPSCETIPIFIGHNIENFDLRFILQRSIVLGITPPKYLPLNSKSYFNQYIFDTMTEWAGKRNFVSLNELCIAFGIPPKDDDIDGSKVWDFVKSGDIKRVAEYCADDVEKVRSIYKKMTFNEMN